MNFPILAETFAIGDVRTLKDAEVDISVHSLRSAQSAAPELTKKRLADVPITQSSAGAILGGLALMFKRPSIALALLAWIARHSLKSPKRNRRLEQLAKSALLVPRTLQLFDALERNKPDVVHLFWGHYPAMFAYLVQKYHPEIVSSVFLGAYDLKTAYGGSAPVARQADVVWTHARANVEEIERLGVDANLIRVAYRGVDLTRFESVDWQRKVKRRIVTAGRLASFKKMDDVLRVFQRTLSQWSDATLVVLGDGPERERLEALSRSLGVAHAVTFRGHVAHEEVFVEMAQAEVFLLMSQHSAERLPNVIKEAMGCRCVCVTTRTPGIEELLVDGEHGYVVAQGDVESAAHHIAEVFANADTAQRVTGAAYAHLERHFDIHRLAEVYKDTWRALISEKRTRGSATEPQTGREDAPRTSHSD